MLHPYNESNVTIFENMDSNAKEIANYINEIGNGQKNIRKIKKNLGQLSGKEEESNLRMTQNLYDYWSWTILMIIIIWLLYNCYTNKEHSTMITLYILAILTLIYIFHSQVFSV